MKPPHVVAVPLSEISKSYDVSNSPDGRDGAEKVSRTPPDDASAATGAADASTGPEIGCTFTHDDQGEWNGPVTARMRYQQGSAVLMSQ